MVKIKISEEFQDKAVGLVSELLAGLAHYCQDSSVTYKITVSRGCTVIHFEISEYVTNKDNKIVCKQSDAYENSFVFHFLKYPAKHRKIHVFKLKGQGKKIKFEPFKF